MPLCSQTKSTNQRLEAMQWYFGKRHCRTVTPASDDTDFGDYFELNVIDYDYSEKKYLVVLDDGIITPPTPSADQTLVSVSVTAGDSAADKASAIKTQLEADSVLVRLELSGDSVEIQNALVGAISTEDQANAPAITFELGAAGFGGYIGQTGESELTTNVEVVQLLDDAQGTVVQDEIITGYGAEITIPVREMTKENWESLVGEVTGNNITIDSKDITGWGTEKLYQSMFQYSGRLVGHPVRNDATNIDEDITMLNTAPKMNSINFSGASIQEAEFLFTSYKEANADAKINLVARGDHSKF
jgi:phosphohistidine swiveling domain-containing protein